MSLKSWKNEFYPVPAEESIESDLVAVEHSLRKWTGASLENVMRHRVRYTALGIRDEKNCLTFGALDCALCLRYRHAEYGDENCFNSELSQSCPLVRVTGKPCDGDQWIMKDQHGVEKVIRNTWYQSFNDPAPMHALLSRALDAVRDGR